MQIDGTWISSKRQANKHILEASCGSKRWSLGLRTDFQVGNKEKGEKVCVRVYSQGNWKYG